MLTIGAIAKNEGKYVVEWLAYHFALGADRIIIFSNDSEDDQLPLLRKVSAMEPRLTVVDWPSPNGDSPQVAAYRQALRMICTEWVSFIDVDEFIVPTIHSDIREYLESVPDDITSIHLNWRNFGSSGVEIPGYELVTRTFTQGPQLQWGNHHHFKSIARAAFVEDVSIHNIQTRTGKRVLSDFSAFETVNDGLSNLIVHSPLRIHHYQCKTFEEFAARMRRGDANFPPGHPGRSRDESIERFRLLDVNEVTDESIRKFDKKIDEQLHRIRVILST